VPRIPNLIAGLCLSGCAIAGLFVLADGSVRTQLEVAMLASHVPLSEATTSTGSTRTRSGSLDKRRLAATIAGITQTGLD
jgi:hypothetical protein